MQCTNQLKQIMLALQNYHDAFEKFPPASLKTHSWRVRLDCFLIASPYYNQYRFDEPSSSEWNRTLEFRRLPNKKSIEEQEPDPLLYEIDPDQPSRASYLWQCPDLVDRRSPHTSYLMMVGPNAVGLADDGRNISEITDDPALTIMIAETNRQDISWLDPKDFDVETMSFQINDHDRPSISSEHPKGPWVGMVDGSVVQLSPELPPEVVKAMITINGGETIVRDENAPGGYRLAK